MSTIHTEASVAASEVEPSASGVYDYSESINDNDEKLDEGLRAPIPHDDDLDTSLLSDNELEAFVKHQSKHYGGKQTTIPPNLLNIFQRLSGYSRWDQQIYKESQIKPIKSPSKHPTSKLGSDIASIQHASTISQLPQIQQSPLQHEVSYSEDPRADLASSQLNLEQSPFASITPATSAINILSEADANPLDPIGSGDETIQTRKQTLSFPVAPASPTPLSTLQATDSNISAAPQQATKPKLTIDEKQNDSVQSQQSQIGSDLSKIMRKRKNETSITSSQNKQQPVQECTMKELMKHVSNLSSEVINLQQSLYIKDIMIKNLYLRLKEFEHISFPQLLIERIHIVANYNNKHKYSHKSNFQKPERHKYNKRMTLSEEDSVSHDAPHTTNGHGAIGAYGPYTQQYAPYKQHHSQNSDKISNMVKHHSTVTLEVITRWLPRYNLPHAVKKGHLFIKDEDIGDVDDYLANQMWQEWKDRMQNKSYSNNGLDKLKGRDEVHKQLNNYMQHERVGLIRIEILRGKKYKKYKRIEKKFESLIIPIPDIPKGDTYHIMIKVHNPSASLWGPLSNMQSIKVPLKFNDEDDTDNDDGGSNNIINNRLSTYNRTSPSKKKGKK